MNFLKTLLPILALTVITPINAKVTLTTTPTETSIANEYISELRNFTKVYMAIKKMYVEDKASSEIFEGAIQGMLGSLDPHSAYLLPKDQKKMMDDTKGEFGGLGIVVTKRDKIIEVISPIDDTPAYREGIQAKDKIIRINGKSVIGMPLEDAVDIMRGKPDTMVTVTISREGVSPFKVKITREIIKIESVKSTIIDDVAYLRVSNFQSPTADILRGRIEDIKPK